MLISGLASMATGSGRFRLLELRISRTFLDQLRPQLSGQGGGPFRARVLKSRFIESRPEGAITCEQRPGWAVEGGVEDAAGKRGALEGFGVALFCRPEGAETGKPRAPPWELDRVLRIATP